jgi:hypothetical protein
MICGKLGQFLSFDEEGGWGVEDMKIINAVLLLFKIQSPIASPIGRIQPSETANSKVFYYFYQKPTL